MANVILSYIQARGPFQTIFGKINVTVTLTIDPPPPPPHLMSQEKDNNIKNPHKNHAFKLAYEVNVTVLSPDPPPPNIIMTLILNPHTFIIILLSRLQN